MPHRRAGLLILLVATLGCTPAGSGWVKPGTQSGDLERDLAACAAEARNLTPPPYFDPRTGSAVTGPPDTLQRRNACMMQRGWQPGT